MRRLLLAGTLALAACAHSSGSSAGLAARPHQGLALEPIQGVTEEQSPVLEGAICQGLVEANHGDVSCPESVRQALQVARLRSLSGSDTGSGDQILETLNAVEQHIAAVVTRDGQDWVLTLSYLPKRGAQPAATQTLKAQSFEDLVVGSTKTAHALLE